MNTENERRAEQELPEVNEMDVELAALLRKCGRTLFHMGGGRGGQLRLLSMLSREGPISQREMTERAGIQPGSMSEILTKMEQRALIERAPMEGDRRTFCVRITPEGQRELGVLRSRNDAAASALFTQLSEEEKRRLVSLLQKLTMAWQDEPRGRRRD